MSGLNIFLWQECLWHTCPYYRNFCDEPVLMTGMSVTHLSLLQECLRRTCSYDRNVSATSVLMTRMSQSKQHKCLWHLWYIVRPMGILGTPFQLKNFPVFLRSVHCKDKIPKFRNKYSQEKEYRGLSPNFHIHASVSDLYIPTTGLPILLQEICRPILRLYM